MRASRRTGSGRSGSAAAASLARPNSADPGTDRLGLPYRSVRHRPACSGAGAVGIACGRSSSTPTRRIGSWYPWSRTRRRRHYAITGNPGQTSPPLVAGWADRHRVRQRDWHVGSATTTCRSCCCCVAGSRDAASTAGATDARSRSTCVRMVTAFTRRACDHAGLTATARWLPQQPMRRRSPCRSRSLQA